MSIVANFWKGKKKGQSWFIIGKCYGTVSYAQLLGVHFFFFFICEMYVVVIGVVIKNRAIPCSAAVLYQ